MTPFDFAFVAVLLALGLAGLVRGFVSEVLGLFAWVASIWASIRLADAFEPFVHPLTDHPVARWLLASAAVGMIVYIVISIAARLISRAVKDSFVGPINRMLGLLVGSAKALVIIGAATFVGLQFGIAEQDWWRKSHLAPVALQASMLLDRAVDFGSLIKGDRDLEMPKAIEETEERARQFLQDIGSAPSPPKPQE